MNPAFSVIFLTTLVGAGQGLFLALYAAEWASRLSWLALPDQQLFVWGAGIAAVLSIGGLLASFAHLGRPERAWRTATMWRTSWLSREVIVLPAFIGLVVLYGAAHVWAPAWSFFVGAAAAVVCLALFVCTGMIYACIKFLREWASALTPINFHAARVCFGRYAGGGARGCVRVAVHGIFLRLARSASRSPG